MGKIFRIVIPALVLVSGLVIGGCSSSPAPTPVPQVGNPAPDFQLQSLDGQAVSLSALRGRPVLLNFWATWCGPCQIEMPFLQEAFDDSEWSEKGLVILAVNQGESPSRAKQFMERNDLSFLVLLDTNFEVSEAYNASRIPVTFFIDKDGIIKDKKIGPFTSQAEIDWRLINSILADE